MVDLVPCYISQNFRRLIPNEIKLIILDYLNDFRGKMCININKDNIWYNKILKAKDKNQKPIYSRSVSIGDLELLLKFNFNGHNDDNLGSTQIVLLVYSHLLSNKISKIDILFFSEIIELKYNIQLKYAWKMPENSYGTNKYLIPKSRMIHILKQQNKLTINGEFRILNIYDINETKINRNEWNKYLNIKCNNTFNIIRKYINILNSYNINSIKNIPKMGDIVGVHSISQINTIFKVVNDKQSVYVVKALNGEMYNRLMFFKPKLLFPL